MSQVPAFVPSVSLVNSKPAVTSLKIAEHFNKRHDHVVRDIRRIMGEVPENFTAPNFGVSEYTDETGRTLPMFTIHRDGFMLLVMGYTGKKALQIKLAYIEAFNAMEAELAGKTCQCRQQKRIATKALPAADKWKTYDFDKAYRENKEIAREVWHLLTTIPKQVEALAKRIDDSFDHTNRLSNVMSRFDMATSEQGKAAKYAADAIRQALGSVEAQAESMAHLALVMKRVEQHI